MMPTMTNDRSGRQALRVCRLLEVFRAARVLTSTSRKVGHGVYEMEPAAMLALRSSLATAAMVLPKEGCDQWES